MRLCECGSGKPSQWEYDGNGIELCRACPSCRDRKLKQFRPEILKPYTQNDVNEDIEPESDCLGTEREWFSGFYRNGAF
jgi:hypothetical protein